MTVVNSFQSSTLAAEGYFYYMETGIPIPNSAAALQNHLLGKVSKLKMVNLVPKSLFRLSTPLATEFPLASDKPLHSATLKGTKPSPYWAGRAGPAVPMGAHLGHVVKPWVQPPGAIFGHNPAPDSGSSLSALRRWAHLEEMNPTWGCPWWGVNLERHVGHIVTAYLTKDELCWVGKLEERQQRCRTYHGR